MREPFFFHTFSSPQNLSCFVSVWFQTSLFLTCTLTSLLRSKSSLFFLLFYLWSLTSQFLTCILGTVLCFQTITSLLWSKSSLFFLLFYLWFLTSQVLTCTLGIFFVSNLILPCFGP